MSDVFSVPHFPPRELPADRLHVGVRATSLLIWAVALVGSYAVQSTLWQWVLGAGGSWIVFGAIALLAAHFVAMWSERRLMALWPSGRRVRLAEHTISLLEKDATTTIQLVGKRVNNWLWFSIIRTSRGRINDGDYCCALRLLQSQPTAPDSIISLYAFFSPAQAKPLITRYTFCDLRHSLAVAKLPAERLRLSPRDTTYLAAEDERWLQGAELEPDDFEAVLTHLTPYLPELLKTP